MSKRDISNISDFRADENLGAKQPHEHKHDPLMCNACLESDVRIFKAVDIISQAAAQIDLTYNEFLEAVGKVIHYYENMAEIMGVEAEEMECLMPVFDPTPYNDFLYDEDDFDD